MELVQFLVILKIHNYKYSILGSVTLYILYNMVQYLSLVLLLPWLRYKMTGLFILKAHQFFLKFQRVNWQANVEAWNKYSYAEESFTVHFLNLKRKKKKKKKETLYF